MTSVPGQAEVRRDDKTQWHTPVPAHPTTRYRRHNRNILPPHPRLLQQPHITPTTTPSPDSSESDSTSPIDDADSKEDDIQQLYTPRDNATREDSESEDEAKQEKQHRAFMVYISKRNEGVASSTVTIDEEDPRIRKVLTLLPKEFRFQGLQAITTEIETLVDQEVFEWVNLPPGGKTIRCRLVEKVKYKGDGSFGKVKMRCVVKGYTQRPGRDFGEVYSSTVMLSAIRR